MHHFFYTTTHSMAQRKPDAMGGRFEIYVNWRRQWRWRRRAENGKILYAATEGYKNFADCLSCLASSVNEDVACMNVYQVEVG